MREVRAASSPLGWTRVLARSVQWASTEVNAVLRFKWNDLDTETHKRILKYTDTQAHRQTDTQIQARRNTSTHRHRYRLTGGLLHSANGFGTTDVAGRMLRQQACEYGLVGL